VDANKVKRGRDFIRMMMPIFGLGDNNSVVSMKIEAACTGIATAEVTMFARNDNVTINIEPEANNSQTKRYIIEVTEIDEGPGIPTPRGPIG
jgi:hypothetical protein